MESGAWQPVGVTPEVGVSDRHSNPAALLALLIGPRLPVC